MNWLDPITEITPRLVWSKNLQQWRCQSHNVIAYGRLPYDAYRQWLWKQFGIPPGEA